MQKLLLLIALIGSTISYSQTAITNENLEDAIADCLSTNSVNGLCTNSEYGEMPGWIMTNVTDMHNIFFDNPTFNADISNWNTSNVNDMSGMFYGASAFNQNLSNWNVSNVTTMVGMFEVASIFNGDISNWNTSNVNDMKYMFRQARGFNRDLSQWDVTNVTLMYNMFDGAISFNQDISTWETDNVTRMDNMFDGATDFNQNLSTWKVSKMENMYNMFDNSALSTDNYDAILIGWSESTTLKPFVGLGAAGISYCNSIAARQILTENGWVINDAGVDCSTAGIDDQNQLDISIYPNPTSKTIYIQGYDTQLKVVFYNILGKEVLNKSIKKSIDISHLENGIYLMQLSNDGKSSTHKIIKN